MEKEASAGLDRSTVMNSTVRRLARVDVQLGQQATKAKACPLVADADANSAVFVMSAQSDDGALEARIAHSGHRQEQFASEVSRFFHAPKMGRGRRRSKP